MNEPQYKVDLPPETPTEAAKFAYIRDLMGDPPEWPPEGTEGLVAHVMKKHVGQYVSASRLGDRIFARFYNLPQHMIKEVRVFAESVDDF